jgi:hypothetical protein
VRLELARSEIAREEGECRRDVSSKEAGEEGEEPLQLKKDGRLRRESCRSEGEEKKRSLVTYLSKDRHLWLPSVCISAPVCASPGLALRFLLQQPGCNRVGRSADPTVVFSPCRPGTGTIIRESRARSGSERSDATQRRNAIAAASASAAAGSVGSPSCRQATTWAPRSSHSMCVSSSSRFIATGPDAVCRCIDAMFSCPNVCSSTCRT